MGHAMGLTGDARGADGAARGDGECIQFRLDSLWRTRNSACGWDATASCRDNPVCDSQPTHKEDLEAAWTLGRRDWPQFGRNLNERSYSFRDVGISDQWLLFPKRAFAVIATL